MYGFTFHRPSYLTRCYLGSLQTLSHWKMSSWTLRSFNEPVVNCNLNPVLICLHHQLPCYYSRMANTKAAGIDAFQHNWNMEPTPYVNPPWTLIPKVLCKIIHDRVRVMMVVPHWPSADWFPLFYRLTEKSIRIIEPCYLNDNGRLRPA